MSEREKNREKEKEKGEEDGREQDNNITLVIFWITLASPVTRH